jgi:cytoskeletal protein CcmA (bactofilin family)
MLSAYADHVPAAQANDAPLILSAATTVLGCMELPGEVILHGHLDGELHAARVFVSRGGIVSGTVIASEVVIDGEARDAIIYANRIVLRRGARVTGEIYHRELVLEEGNLFEGKSRRHADPTSLAPAVA